MTGTDLEHFRIALLSQLARVGESSLPLATLHTGVKLAGFETISEQVVRAELVYLQDKGLVEVQNKILSPENKRWRIKAAGRDFLAEAGL